MGVAVSIAPRIAHPHVIAVYKEQGGLWLARFHGMRRQNLKQAIRLQREKLTQDLRAYKRAMFVVP